MKHQIQPAGTETVRAFSDETLSFVEQLESRRLMSAIHATMHDGVLRITGTGRADTISMSVTLKSELILTENGSSRSYGKYYSSGIEHVEIYALGGNDRITIGNDVASVYVNGGSGNDTINTGDGDDTLTGAGGNDYINGGEGRDFIKGLSGNDRLFGGPKSDRIFGGDGNDTLSGNDGSDYLYGDNGNDSLLGGNGDDSLNGAAGKDTLDGEQGNDILVGGAGDDNLTGGSDHDTLYGNAGSDHLNLRDLESDVADGGSGVDWATIDDFEKSFVVAEMKAY